MSDRVGIMSHGRLEQVSPPRELYERPVSRFVADFVGSSNQLACTVHSASNENYRVELTGRTLDVNGAAGLSSGSDAIAIVRPEKVRWVESDHPDVILDGVVKDVAYLGAHTIVTVRTDTHGDLTMAGASRGLPTDVNAGDSIRIGWDAADVWAVAP